MATWKNRELFVRNPTTTTIPNDGVAKVIEPESAKDWAVLRYELESFVCEGEYAKGLERVLSTFLANLDQEQQPAVWVSGFYGSGKSHFGRVLEYLWRDVEFPDGARARSLASLPGDIKALLVELSTRGKQEGGLWSAAGTLGSTATSVRLGLLAILFRSAKLPEQYSAARLVLRLRQNGGYDAVTAAIEASGKPVETELRNMYVSPVLADALTGIPGFGDTAAEARSSLRTQYPVAPDISDDELRNTMADVLALQSTTKGKLPLTLLVFDELQQFIAEDSVRTLQVQEAVEACSARFGGRLLFVATGQSALGALPQLQKLQGRFSRRVALSDTDVERVVREVVLRKEPDKVNAVRKVLEQASGEIDRHLAGTKIGSQAADRVDWVADYPLLPVRRRFWERALRAVDSAGMAGQLRTQLKVVHEATRDVAEKPLGWVVPGDAMYWKIETDLQQIGVLDRDLATRIHQVDNGTPEGRLNSRLCALVFLIGKLPTDGPAAAGVRATADTLADLLVEDLPAGSGALRQQVPVLLRGLADAGILMVVGDEYRLQTRESSEWETDFKARFQRIHADDVRVATDRGTALKSAVATALKGLTFQQGASKVKRELDTHFGGEPPPTDTAKAPVWVRDEWSATERTVREDAQAAGSDSPVVYVFLPRLQADDLNQALARLGAAVETIGTRAMPQTLPGQEARQSMQSRVESETANVQQLVGAIIRNARVYQGGGNEIEGSEFAPVVKEAVEAAVERLFPKFSLVDQAGWDRVVTRARQGAADAFTALGYSADVDKHPASQEVRTFVGGGGKKGAEVRRHFEGVRYGWPRDAVDGVLLALLAGGYLRASLNGHRVQANELTQGQIGTVDFFSEGVTVTVLQRLELRNLAAAMGLNIKSGEEGEGAQRVLARLADLAQAAGGDPPLPARPDDEPVRLLQALAGNEQLTGVHARRADLQTWHRDWSTAAETIRQRHPEWQRIEALRRQAESLAVASEVDPQIAAIRIGRGLLDEPNPLTPIAAKLTAALRAAVNDASGRQKAARDREIAALDASDDWSRLKPGQRDQLLAAHDLLPVAPPAVGSDEELLASLAAAPLSEWATRVDAVPTRAAKAREEAARLVAPKAVTVRPPPATLRTAEDVTDYLDKLRGELLAHLSPDTPVVIL